MSLQVCSDVDARPDDVEFDAPERPPIAGVDEARHRDSVTSTDGRRREQFASSVDWRCDLVGIAQDTPVRWVLNRKTMAIVWLNFREVEDGPWVLGTKAEGTDFGRKLLEDHPELLDQDVRPRVTVGAEFPSWVRTLPMLRDDGRWEFVG